LRLGLRAELFDRLGADFMGVAYSLYERGRTGITSGGPNDVAHRVGH
jgi:hypothetical protein